MVLICSSFVLSLPTHGQAQDNPSIVLNSPNKSANGDVWCVRNGSFIPQDFYCIVAGTYKFNIGKRMARKDRFRGVGGVVCEVNQPIRLWENGYLRFCYLARGHTETNLQRRDGTFARAEEIGLMTFDPEGFLVSVKPW